MFNEFNDLNNNERMEELRMKHPEAMIAYELQQQNKLLFCINDTLKNIHNNETNVF